MDIRSDALPWFSINYGSVAGPVYASKFYKPEESWTKTRVWWFEILLNRIEENKNTSIHLLCQVAPTETEFHYLKVPAYYFLQHMDKLYKRENKVSIYLSADVQNRFVEQRGKGKVSFSRFLVVDR